MNVKRVLKGAVTSSNGKFGMDFGSSVFWTLGTIRKKNVKMNLFAWVIWIKEN